jgi:hypothetical protein
MYYLKKYISIMIFVSTLTTLDRAKAYILCATYGVLRTTVPCISIVSLTLVKLYENDRLTDGLGLYGTNMYVMSTCCQSQWSWKYQAFQQPIESLSEGTSY